MSRSNHDKTQK